ncbi:TfoX/Sxy family DNA transformation protein [Nocardia neocaledoniensis]|uniref:TfoX/Sxy family DNA transformation protein n=1 Tax=Nocardia neocaledoniensis TaxID=236511 RepID=UPI002457F20B|nr:TfoX/Sxy family DNA transformation protein [Nocardia neocaledoniensis]
MKLHRHAVRGVRGVRTVITPRPGTHARFSTNRFHDTWHVLSDDRGARMLVRLLWGLSFQARPGTVVLLDREFLTPTPFDADPADPIVLAPGWCTRFDDHAAAQLKQLARSADSSTVRWHTFGLERALTAEEPWTGYRRVHGDISRRRGLLVLSPATPDDARRWALDAARLDSSGNGYGTDYTYLDEWDHGHDGEIQVFRRFHRMTSVARQARAQVLGRADAPSDPDAVRVAVWDEAEKVRGEAHLRIRERRGALDVLGAAAADMLAAAEVRSLDDLAELGAVETYRRLWAAETPGLTLEMLWALEGALTRRDRRSIDPERRRALLAELGDTPAPKTRPRRRYRAPIRPIRR